MNNIEIVFELLEASLRIYLTCLRYDFLAILLNETLDEPTQTNLPLSWAPQIQDKSSIQALVYLAKMNLTRVDFMNNDNFKLSTQLALKCLTEFANIR